MANALLHCRVCGGENLVEVLSLGPMPLVNAFLATAPELANEKRYPLSLALCEGCTHVQSALVVEPSEMFHERVDLPGASPQATAWAQTLATRYTERLAPGPDALVVDVGSSDGTFLAAFRGRCRTLGVDPAQNAAAEATQRGIPTVTAFFDSALGKALRDDHGPARLVLARHVLTHVPNVLDFTQGLADWLAADGLLHLEVPWLGDLVEAHAFEQLHHEHLSYFSVTALEALLRYAGLVLLEVERAPADGGLVLRAQKQGTAQPSVAAFCAREKALGLGNIDVLTALSQTLAVLRENLSQAVASQAARGPLAAWGASPGAIVLSNLCHISPAQVSWVADPSPHRQGRLTPGMHLQVVPVEQVLKRMPERLLVLEPVGMHGLEGEYVARGGQLLVRDRNWRLAP